MIAEVQLINATEEACVRLCSISGSKAYIYQLIRLSPHSQHVMEEQTRVTLHSSVLIQGINFLCLENHFCWSVFGNAWMSFFVITYLPHKRGADNNSVTNRREIGIHAPDLLDRESHFSVNEKIRISEGIS